MKFKLILCCLAIGFLASSCKNRGGGAETSSPTDDSQSIAEMEIDMDDQGHDEELGIQTIRGKLVTDKGMQPRIQNIFISTDAFEEDGQDWMPRVKELAGKTMEVKGMVIRHWCGPMEQCLTQGYMDRIREPEYLKVID